ncbi:hypothetical protein [Arcanobacterium urinimassiliense]|nr:hypothetical protein [Arcanobacterium urinimassiliense]
MQVKTELSANHLSGGISLTFGFYCAEIRKELLGAEVGENLHFRR